MASAVIEPASRPLSLHIDTPASASPFPSPSSSFLPPPMPGAHEFAVKPPPRRKSTTLSSPSAPDLSHQINSNQQQPTADKHLSMPLTAKPTTNGHPPGLLAPSNGPPSVLDSDAFSPTTPTPSNLHHNYQSLPAAAGPAPPPIPQPDPSTPPPNQPPSSPPEKPPPAGVAAADATPFATPTTPLSSPSHPDNTTTTTTRPPLSPVLTNSPSLASSRPAPPSPAESRRISTISVRSSGSRPPSAAVSRSNSQRRSIGMSLVGLSSTPGSKRQSQLSALSTGSGNPIQSPQLTSFAGLKEEADEGSMSAVLKASTAAAALAATTPTTASPATGAKPNPRTRSTRVKIKIRDFAFVASDERYRGMGVNVPKHNRFARLNKKLGGSRKVRPTSKRWSTASSSSTNNTMGASRSSSEDDEDGEGDEEEDESEGWFRRGMGRFSWSFGFGGLKKQQQHRQQQGVDEEQEQDFGGSESYPSRGDMERNFLEEEGDDASGQSSEVYYDAEDNLGDNRREEGGDEDEDEEPLYPGLYRAMFAFEPEGTAEMGLAEDQVVRVVGRGGGVGWAVAVVPEGGEGGVEVGAGIRHALVPESYLEAVELD